VGGDHQIGRGLTRAAAAGFPRRCPCPGSVPWSAAGWPAAGGMAYSVLRLALAKSRWLFAAL